LGRALTRQTFHGVDRRRRVIEGVGFSPLELSGVVTSWFRLASGTITGAGYASIPDLLDPANPLAQATDNKRPPNATSSNALPIITTATAFMPVAVTAARANVTTWGFWGWFKQATNADNSHSFHTSAGSSVNRHFLFFRSTGAGLRFQVFTNATDSRIVDVSGLTAAAWNFFTVEFNGNLSGDARAIISVNGSVPSQTYGTGTGVASMPATLQAVTGNGSMFALGSSGPYFVGSGGGNFGFLGGAMSGATEGLLTAAARAALMNFEAPT
jgi:hypothetical protein